MAYPLPLRLALQKYSIILEILKGILGPQHITYWFIGMYIYFQNTFCNLDLTTVLHYLNAQVCLLPFFSVDLLFFLAPSVLEYFRI